MAQLLNSRHCYFVWEKRNKTESKLEKLYHSSKMFLKNSHFSNQFLHCHTFLNPTWQKINFKFRKYISTFTLFWSSFILWFQHSSCWLVGWPQLISYSWRSANDPPTIGWWSADDWLTINWRSAGPYLSMFHSSLVVSCLARAFYMYSRAILANLCVSVCTKFFV